MKMDFLPAASLGIEIAVMVFLGAGVGYLIDVRFTTKPWGLAAGVLVGAIAGFWAVYKDSLKG